MSRLTYILAFLLSCLVTWRLASQVQVNWQTLNQAQKIEVLQNRLSQVEKYLTSTGGAIKEYHVDTAIGAMVCRSCKLEEEEKKK